VPVSVTSRNSSIRTEHIAAFQNRANFHARVSYAIIALILILFGIALYIFWFAQDIDKSRGSVELFQQLQIEKKNQPLLIKAAETAYNGVREEARVGQRTTADVLSAFNLLNEDKIRLLVLEEKERLMVEVGYFAELDVIKSKEELAAQKKGMMEVEAALTETLKSTRDRFNVGEVTATDVAQAERFLAEATSKREIIDQKIKVALPAAQIKNTTANIDTLEVVRTSLIRFGGVAVILFLISVLVPIYRYNVRLASYYLARADTLVLARDTKVENFSEMMKLLTPVHAFEKEPTTPIESVSSFVKEAAGILKKT
jgi:hypothetical protein